MSHRKEQVQSTLKRAISQVLATQISDPRIVGMISVTQIDISPDLRNAKVYVSVLPEKYQKRSVHGLRHAAGHIYSLVCKVVALRIVPKLDFRLDESLKKQNAVFDDIRRGLEQDQKTKDNDQPLIESESIGMIKTEEPSR